MDAAAVTWEGRCSHGWESNKQWEAAGCLLEEMTPRLWLWCERKTEGRDALGSDVVWV